jgi:amidase
VTEIIFDSAASLAEAIRQKRVSSSELTQAYLERIERVNPSLNAVVMLDDTAMEQARAADSGLAKGEDVGPLHGVPITLKDSHDTVGVVTTGGTLGRADFVPDRDSTVAARLRAAGVVLLGKTNTPELTMGMETDNLVYGRTNNPYDTTRTSGGSSGGGAAIVAAGGSAFDIGSDTGGSIRFPGHCCGVAGIKPTSGRVPRTGHIIPYGMGIRDSLTQIGPIARYIEDLALVLPIIAGPDWKDPAIVPMPLGDPGCVDLSRLRVAFYTDNGVKTPTSETINAVTAAASALSDAGATVAEDRPDAITQYEVAWKSLPQYDDSVKRLLDAAGTTEPHPWTLSVLQSTRSMTVAELDELMEEVDAFRSDILAFMEDYDLLLSPTMPTPAQPHDVIRTDRLPYGSYTRPHNLTGWPTAVVRGGTSPEGLPIGVQIAALPWREDVALAAAQLVESASGGWSPPSI